jgi:hypothetical protein
MRVPSHPTQIRRMLESRLKALIQEVSQLSVALIKGHVRHRRLRRGRP